jgi:hypothetical protein
MALGSIAISFMGNLRFLKFIREPRLADTEHHESTAKPPGGSFRVTFTSPDAMVWQDVNFGGTLAYRPSE